MFLTATGGRCGWCCTRGLGWHFKAIGQAPLYAATRGISLYRTQVLAFVVGGVLAGAAGAFWSQYFGTMQAGGAELWNPPWCWSSR